MASYDLIVTSGITGVLIWHWSALIPRVLVAVQPVAAAVWRQRPVIEELQESALETR